MLISLSDPTTDGHSETNRIGNIQKEYARGYQVSAHGSLSLRDTDCARKVVSREIHVPVSIRISASR